MFRLRNVDVGEVESHCGPQVLVLFAAYIRGNLLASRNQKRVSEDAMILTASCQLQHSPRPTAWRNPLFPRHGHMLMVGAHLVSRGGHVRYLVLAEWCVHTVWPHKLRKVVGFFPCGSHTSSPVSSTQGGSGSGPICKALLWGSLGRACTWGPFLDRERVAVLRVAQSPEEILGAHNLWLVGENCLFGPGRGMRKRCRSAWACLELGTTPCAPGAEQDASKEIAITGIVCEKEISHPFISISFSTNAPFSLCIICYHCTCSSHNKRT